MNKTYSTFLWYPKKGMPAIVVKTNDPAFPAQVKRAHPQPLIDWQMILMSLDYTPVKSWGADLDGYYEEWSITRKG